MPNPRVFINLSVEGVQIGRVVFELFADVVPKTAENFRALCTGSAGVNTAGVPLYYKGSLFHRIIAGFMVQGGDFTLRNGKGGESIYGGTFEDEDLKRDIDAEGLLVMANRGKNTNGSQFFISLRPCPHLAGKHCVFGKVVKGYEIIEDISKLPTNEKDYPDQLVTIANCGELELRKVAKKPRSPSPSRSRSISRSRSPTPLSDDSTSRRRSSKSKHSSSKSKSKSSSSKKHKHKSSSSKKHRHRSPSPAAAAPQPTEEDLAKVAEQQRMQELEAEEQKRFEERRRRELEEVRRRNEDANRSNGGIKYKGRGVMKAPGETGGYDSGGMRGW